MIYYSVLIVNSSPLWSDSSVSSSFSPVAGGSSLEGLSVNNDNTSHCSQMINMGPVWVSSTPLHGLLLCHGTQQNLSLSTVTWALYAKHDKAAMKFSPAPAGITFAISPSLSPPRRGLVHTVCVCTNYPRFIWIHKITYTYHALGMNMNHAFLFYANKESGCSSRQSAVFYGFIICCFCCEGWLCSRWSHALQAMYEGGKCFCCYLWDFLKNRLVTLLTVSCRKMDALQAMYEGGKCFCKSIGYVVDCKL